MEYFNHVPEEITLNILKRVPTEYVLGCKSVCTNWNNLISHPSFNKMHLHHLSNPLSDSGNLGFLVWTGIWDLTSISVSKFQYVEFDENLDELTTPIPRIRRFNFALPFKNTKLLGLCNGLIFLSGCSSFPDKRVFICNPITKEYVVLPRIMKYHPYTNRYQNQMSGFGYVSSTNEYKIVGIYAVETKFEVHIYTVGSGNGWRNLGMPNLESNIAYYEAGVFVNGVLYWMGVDKHLIVAFDLAEEEFYEPFKPPRLPPSNYDSDWSNNSMGVLDGFLYFAVWLKVEGDKCYHDIWLLKTRNENRDMIEREEYQSSWVWSKKCRIDNSKLFAVTKTGHALTFTHRYLNIYDPTASTSERLVEFNEPIRRVLPHKNTLVSLTELGEEDTMTMASVEFEELESHDQP